MKSVLVFTWWWRRSKSNRKHFWNGQNGYTWTFTHGKSMIISSIGTRTHRTVIPQIFITSSVHRPPTGPPTEKAEEVTINKWVSISVAYKEFYWSASNYHTTSLATYTQHIQLWICHHHILNVICLCKTKCLCRPISYSLIVEVGWQNHL